MGDVCRYFVWNFYQHVALLIVLLTPYHSQSEPMLNYVTGFKLHIKYTTFYTDTYTNGNILLKMDTRIEYELHVKQVVSFIGPLRINTESVQQGLLYDSCSHSGDHEQFSLAGYRPM